MWMRADYLRYSSNVLEAVCTDISSEVYDIIVTDWDDIYKIGNKKYNDQLTFFKDCCGCMTLYGSVIVKLFIYMFSSRLFVPFGKKIVSSENITFSSPFIFIVESSER